MRTNSAGPDGSMSAGKIYNVDDSTAKQLVDGKYAIYAEKPKLEKAVAKKPPEKSSTQSKTKKSGV